MSCEIPLMASYQFSMKDIVKPPSRHLKNNHHTRRYAWRSCIWYQFSIDIVYEPHLWFFNENKTSIQWTSDVKFISATKQYLWSKMIFEQQNQTISRKFFFQKKNWEKQNLGKNFLWKKKQFEKKLKHFFQLQITMPSAHPVKISRLLYHSDIMWYHTKK